MADNPFYPELSEDGAKAAQVLIDKFKDQMKKVAENVLGELYTDIACHIESDSWTNYRNKLMEGFRDYDNRLVQNEHDFASIRAAIYRQFKDDIIKDLDQDNVKRIAELEQAVHHWRDNSYR